MKIENLRKGMIIRNYKDLCLLLGVEPKTNKTYQLKEFARYFKFHKEGFKYIIDEIYEKPLEKIENSAGNNNKYIIEIQDILTDYIYNNRDETGKVVLSFSKIINVLGLVNETYAIGNSRKKELSDILNVKLTAVHYFYNSTRSEFKGIVERALNNLQKRSVIHYTKKKMIAFSTKDENNKRITVYREATQPEIELILDTQRSVLDYLQIKNMQDLLFCGSVKYKEFLELVKAELPKDWKYYFDVYELIVGKYAIKSEYENVIAKRKQDLNQKSIDRVNKCLKIVSDKDDEKQLVEKLVDLLNHDFKLDESIKELYEKNKEAKYTKIKEKKNELYALMQKENEIRQKKQEVLEDSEVVIKLYDERDAISKHDYYSYINEKKEKKFVKDSGLDPDTYSNIVEAFDELFG